MKMMMMVSMIVMLLFAQEVISQPKPPAPAPKKEVKISIQFRITEETKILKGMKPITMEMIPENGTIIDLEVKGDFIVKIVFQDTK